MSNVTLTAEEHARMRNMFDRQDIYECLTRALRAIDRFDRELFLTCFHPDALIDAGGYLNAAATVYDGSAALHREGQTSTIHNLLNHRAEFDGDTAHCETYLMFTGVNNDKTNWIAGGRYLDRFEKRGGAWKIAFRYTLIEWSGIIPPATNPMFDNIADIYANGTPSRSKDDPSYRRPLINRRQMRAVDNPGGLGAPKS
jgi:hypothetical protein